MSQAEDDAFWKEISHAYRKAHGFLPMTAAEADNAYDEAEPIPMTREEIDAIVSKVTGKPATP